MKIGVLGTGFGMVHLQTYCLERIQAGTPGVTDLAEAVPALTLALALNEQI